MVRSKQIEVDGPINMNGYALENAVLSIPEGTGTTIIQNIQFVGPLTFGSSITGTMTGNTNDFAPTGLSGTSMLRITSTGNYKLSGIVAPSPASIKLLFVVNVGTNNITFQDNSASSLAANRFLMGGNKSVQSNEGILFFYDDISLKWRASAINI